eukprot:228736-Alexandrium_andersonii.AAC.1
MGTQRGAFSRARRGPARPRPLRDFDYLRGLPKRALAPAQHEQFRPSTYFAPQSLSFAERRWGRRVGF